MAPTKTPVPIGSRWGRLTVIRKAAQPMYGNKTAYDCRCDCGNATRVVGTQLGNGAIRSCGCLRKEIAGAQAKNRATHGYYGTPTYTSWRGMRQRCERSADYVRRGITVHQPWIDSFECFLRDVGPRPSRAHSLDRINNDGHYEPGNVRWATPSVQSSNRRKPTRGRWTISHDSCLVCGRSDQPHASDGACRTCYMREYRRRHCTPTDGPDRSPV
jgi:hypothetical protein